MEKMGHEEEQEDLRKKAARQYFQYFRFWFLLVIIMGLALLVVFFTRKDTPQRQNDLAPKERVFDYAQVLSQEEEELLRRFIATQEARIQCDIVLVTIREDIEKTYGNWNNGMMQTADDFYDEHGFGYNAYQGDGMLLLDNWETGQVGSWLSTCGAVKNRFGDWQIERVLDAVDIHMPDDPYGAYYDYVETAANEMAEGSLGSFPVWMAVLVPLVVMVIFVIAQLRVRVGTNTVQVDSYIADGEPHLLDKRDTFLGKQVFTKRIPRNNGGSGGGGGGHISSGGVSHGGGGHRR